MTDILLTTTELIDGVEVTGTAATIATTEGAAGDPVGTAAAAVAAHVADTTDAHALAGITGLTAALAGKADDADVTALDGRVDVLEAVNPVLTINGDPPDVDGNVDIEAGGGAVDSVNGQTGVVVLDADDIADGTTNHAFTAADDTKLAGIASGATANATDAQLRDRSTHTGTQLLATISDAGTAAAADTGDFEAAGAVATHAADTTSVHGIADTSALALTGDAPTAHAASHQDGGTDELALDGSQITTGTVADARVASTIARDSEVAATYAPLASPALTGNPTAPTQTAGNDSTRLATTAFVTAAVAAGGGGGSTVYYGQGQATATGENTTLTFDSTPVAGSESIFLESAAISRLLSPSVDYTISGDVVTFIGDLTAGDIVTARWVTTDSTPGGITLSGSAGYSTAILADSPWGFWRFKDPAGSTGFADLSGNNRPFTALAGTPTQRQPGPKNKAVIFPSGANYAVTASSLTQSTISVECWVYIAANPASKAAVIGLHINASSTGDKDIYVGTDGKVNFYWFDGTARTLTSPSAISTGAWHHVVATVGAAGTFLYIDGSQVATHTSTISYTGAAQVINLHYGTDSGNALYNGDTVRIAEPAIYTTQLSAARVAAHYSAV